MVNKIKLLQRVQEKIDRYPKLFDMEHWHNESKCGTTHCIGGWIQVLRGKKENGETCFDQGIRVLGEAAEQLFDYYEWPEVFRDLYDTAKNRKERRAAALMAIDDWMLTHLDVDTLDTHATG